MPQCSPQLWSFCSVFSVIALEWLLRQLARSGRFRTGAQQAGDKNEHSENDTECSNDRQYVADQHQWSDLEVNAYREQVLGLIDGGADVLLVETIFDTLNAKAALFAIDSVKVEKQITIPIMISGTITDASGRTLSGQTVEAFRISLSHLPILSIGFNCALGADQLLPYVKRLSNQSEAFVSAHPNAGLPNAFGEYDQTPEEMQALIEEYLKQNVVNIIGGCCGTTPDHIRLIAEVAKKYTPRKPKVVAHA